MNKDELLKYCRYYHGEKQFPQSLECKSPKAFCYWEAEQMFVETTGTEMESEVVRQYLNAGLASANHSLPLFLLASLFAVFNKSSENDLRVSAAYFVKNFLPGYFDSTSK